MAGAWLGWVGGAEIEDDGPVMRKPWFWEGGKPSRDTMQALRSGLLAAADGYEKAGKPQLAAGFRRKAREMEKGE